MLSGNSLNGLDPAILKSSVTLWKHMPPSVIAPRNTTQRRHVANLLRYLINQGCISIQYTCWPCLYLHWMAPASLWGCLCSSGDIWWEVWMLCPSLLSMQGKLVDNKHHTYWNKPYLRQQNQLTTVVCCRLILQLILLFVDIIFWCWCWSLFRIITSELECTYSRFGKVCRWEDGKNLNWTQTSTTS